MKNDTANESVRKGGGDVFQRGGLKEFSAKEKLVCLDAWEY